MKWRHLIAAALLTVMASPAAMAQVDAQFTQYYEVPGYYNPASVGSSDYLRIRGGSRMQWVGIPHAPVTMVATGDMALKLGSQRCGLGLLLQSESLGLYRNTMAGLQGAWNFRLWGGRLAAGLQLGVLAETFRGSQVILPDGEDGADDGIPTTDVSGTSFDMALGVWYTRGRWWAGLSSTHVNEPAVTMSTEGSGADAIYEFKAGRMVYLTAGGNIPVKNTLLELQPSLLVKSDFTFTAAELTARVRYNRMFTVGAAYRYKDAVAVILGVEYRDFFAGYSYDCPVSDMSRATGGSHEVWGGYRFKLDLSDKNLHRHKSIRIM